MHLLGQFVKGVDYLHGGLLELLVAHPLVGHALAVHADLPLGGLEAGRHLDVVADHNRLQLPQRNRVAFVGVELLEYVPLLLLRQGRIDGLHELVEVLELQLRVFVVAVSLEQPLQVDVLAVDLVSDLAHQVLELVLELVLLVYVRREESFEDLVAEELVPADSVLL